MVKNKYSIGKIIQPSEILNYICVIFGESAHYFGWILPQRNYVKNVNNQWKMWKTLKKSEKREKCEKCEKNENLVEAEQNMIKVEKNKN